MPTQARSNSNSKSTKTQSKAPKKSAPAAASSRPGQARSIAESAVDLPVGAVLEFSDRVAELVEPLTGRTEAEKQLQAYRSRLRRTVKRTERRGTTARRKATAEARKTRSRVEREARKRRRTVEQRVRKALDEQSSRAQGLVDQVSEQLSSLR
jgi:hypothetical protein